MSDKVLHVSDATFEQDVLKANIPVLVDFWAPWCGPCRMIAPIVEQLAEEYAGKLIVAKMNTDENPQTPSRYGIRGIPTLIFFKNGKEVDRVVGVRPKPQIKAIVDRVLSV